VRDVRGTEEEDKDTRYRRRRQKIELTDESGDILEKDISMILDRVLWLNDVSVAMRSADVVVSLQKRRE